MHGEKLHLFGAGALSAALVIGAFAAVQHGERTGSPRAAIEASGQLTGGHVDPPGTPPHRHDDPRTKNAVCRASEQGEETEGPDDLPRRDGGPRRRSRRSAR